MWPVIKKEFKSYFDHPTAYILVVLFLVLNSFFFFVAVFASGFATLQPMFDFLPWLLLVFSAAVTMRTLAEERRSGTLELGLAQPVRPSDILLGKFFGIVASLGVPLLLTIPIPLLLSVAGRFDWGQIIAQYLAALFLIGVMASIGVCASSLTRNQVVAFLVSLVTSFFLIIAGFDVMTLWLGDAVASIFGTLSIFAHYQNMTRGTIDSRDVVYFITVIFAFLSIAYLFLVRELLNVHKPTYRRLKAGVVLLVCIAVVSALLGNAISGRIDLTKNDLYTVSPASRTLLRSLDDIVTIKVFSSPNLPPEFEYRRRDVRDTLRDFERYANGNIHVEYSTIEANGSGASDAESLGIVPVRFDTIKQQQFASQQGYFGLAVVYADRHESIPFIRDTANIEYQLVRFIRKLTATERQQVVFLSGHGEQAGNLQLFKEQLRDQYVVSDFSFSETQFEVPAEISIMVVAVPTQPIPEPDRAAMRNFIKRGGKALFLIEQVLVSPETLSPIPNQYSFSDFLLEYGITVHSDLVYDLRSNENVTFGGGPISYILPYPFWPRVPAVENNPVTGDIPFVVFPWGSSVSLSRAPESLSDVEFLPLFRTSPTAGVQEGNFSITPDTQFSVSPESLAERDMGFAVRFGNTSSAPGSRVVVIGDGDFLTDQFVQNSSAAGNITLGLNAVDWLAQDEHFIGIRSKSRLPATLVFQNVGIASGIHYTNLIGIPVLVVGIGGIRLWRRRKKSRRQMSY